MRVDHSSYGDRHERSAGAPRLRKATIIRVQDQSNLPSMKTAMFILKSLAVLAFAFIASISHATEQAPVSDIEFLDQTYALAWRSDPTPEYSKSEYLPADERLPYHRNMLLVERVSGISVTDAVRAQVEHIKAFGQSEDGVTGARILGLFKKPGSEEVLLVFLLSAPDEQHEVIVEWNAYRYSPYTRADGQTGVRLFGHSARNYGNDDSVYDFLEKLDVDNMQSQRIHAVTSAKLP